jgi:hypothetical protein
MGVRCARCHRYLLGSPARRTLTGRWRHESCAHLPEPTRAEFDQLADTLMTSHPWPRARTLSDELASVLEELGELRSVRATAAQVPRQAGPPDLETVDLEREHELARRGEQLHEAITSEREWKAARLATEWAAGQ